MDDMAAYYPPPSGLLPPHYHSYMPQQQPPPPPAPPFPSYSVTYVAPYSSHDSVRTLFIAGLPEDIKHREIYNLFREFPGYVSSHLRNTNTSQNSPVLFS